jgi:Flp pilus assembly protein TadB
MSILDRPAPPAGEEIHLPGASMQPVLLAFGITLMLLGVTLGNFVLISGVVLSVWVTVRWIADTRREMSHLPEDLDQIER